MPSVKEKKDMKYYLAYGSNLNKEQMQKRCPGAVPVGTMTLKGFELKFKGPLTIEKKNGGRVPLGIWQVNEEHEKALDRYEGFPTFYYKKEVIIPGDKTAFIYIMNERMSSRTTTRHYYDVCAQGYKDFGLDEKYLKEALKKSLEECGR